MSNDKEEKKSDSFTPEEPETEIRDDKENIHRESVMEDQSEAQAAMPDDDAEDADDTAEEILDDDAEEGDDTAEDDIQDDAENDDTAEDIQDDNTEREDEADKMSESTKKKIRRRRRRKGNMGKKPWIIAGSIVGALVVIYLGISAFFIGHFYIDTEINGQDFSGKSVSDVENYIKEQVQDYELTIIEQNNEKDVIKGSDISLTYKENDDIQKAMDAQNPLLWPKAFFSVSSTNVTIDVGYDQDALNTKIQEVKAVTQEQTDPVSAYPKFDGDSFVVEPEVYGTAVNMDVFTQKVAEYITQFKTELNMMDEECYVMPKYTSDSPEVQKACDAMNQYCKASITYTMEDENVVVDKELISTWLKYDDNMQISLDEDAVRKWMREFGKKYDTVGTTRSITTPNGKTVDVSGGTYGWSVDEDSETKTLINSIKNGEVTEKTPAYVQEAASHSEQDWGTTYAEVDLTDQHMWYIVDGSVAFEADVVTGLPTPERETPSGVYSILELKRDKTLVGETDPATGKPIYETPVSYWMRVTWTGVGFHDATWQPYFGGSLYQTNGSHGCINMSYDDAATLYSMLSIGTPVVMHY
nr:peptidoglycan binding domain-containing protein [Mediterraneibacter glycyrrhizinilyticus]